MQDALPPVKPPNASRGASAHEHPPRSGGGHDLARPRGCHAHDERRQGVAGFAPTSRSAIPVSNLESLLIGYLDLGIARPVDSALVDETLIDIQDRVVTDFNGPARG